MPEIEPYADAERFEIEGDDGSPETWVALAVAEVGGTEYALLAAEKSLEDDNADDMDVMIVEYRRGEDPRLGDVPDDATYERAWQHFSEIMGLESSGES